MNKNLGQDNRSLNRNQDNHISNQSNFSSESDKSNLFSFNPSDLDIFDLSTDIYDLPQTNVFSLDTSFVSGQQSDSNSNTKSESASIGKNKQESNVDLDVVASINLLSYSNKNSIKNDDFNSFKDYYRSPESYIDYNKNPDTDDILTFQRKNLLIENHKIKLNDEAQKETQNETPAQKKPFYKLFENSLFSDLPDDFFDDKQEKQEQPKPLQNEFKFNRNFDVPNKNLFKENQAPQLKLLPKDQLQIQSTPQFNTASIYSPQNIQFSSPSSTKDLYQYNPNIFQPTISYQNRFPISNPNQRSSTAPIPAPLMMNSIINNNPIQNSTSTIPIDFSMGLSTNDDPNALFALSTQSFNMAMSNRSLIIQPMALSFEPYEYWLFQERSLTFNDLVCKFFRHNKTNFTKFMYKLYDMLRITTVFPSLRQAVGIYFLNDVAISVDKYAMINMLSLNPKNVDGSLFHKQGNFPTHGFIEVTSENYKEAGFTKNPVYKSKSIRILFNKDHKFVNKVMSTAELDAIAYENKSKKTYKRLDERK